MVAGRVAIHNSRHGSTESDLIDDLRKVSGKDRVRVAGKRTKLFRKICELRCVGLIVGALENWAHLWFHTAECLTRRYDRMNTGKTLLIATRI